MSDLFTIGFTQKSAATFFGLVRGAGIKRVLDVRLNNVSQLAGFSKRDDLAFFLRELCAADYYHLPLLAPTKEMLDAYKKERGSWDEYTNRYLDLMAARRIEQELDRSLFAGGCLLCSEHEPHFCHRRLVADYLAEKWGEICVVHLT